MVETLVKLLFYSPLLSVGGAGDHESFHHHSRGIIYILYTLWGDQVECYGVAKKILRTFWAIKNDRSLTVTCFIYGLHLEDVKKNLYFSGNKAGLVLRE